jgi:CDP-ribitol ribitolphosphotransferase
LLDKFFDKIRSDENLVGYHRGQQIRTVKKGGIKTRVIKNRHFKNVIIEEKQLTKESLIICFDRVFKANDNAEVMYNQLLERGFTNVYFAIDNHCRDYQRLTELNFNLVDYGSSLFKSLYVQADFIFSSSCDNEIINYQGLRFDKQLKFTTKFIFLQHGVITDDLSEWIVDKRFDYIVASTKDEYDFLNKSCNILSSQILQVGLPRFTNLINKEKKMILITPTWRSYLDKETFISSSFYLAWTKLLNELVNRFDGEINFVIHPMFSEYSELFKLDSKVNILRPIDVDYQQLINEALVLITDYSSIFMDFKYLKKDVYFYQFDQEEFFAKHTYKQRLDYTKFGHVVDQKLNIELNSNMESVDFYQEDLIEVLTNRLLEE